jgi:CheY-like chemotaxis protein
LRAGLGIGLTLVKRFAEMHGGSVEARSEGEGRGSDFIVRLPMATGHVDAREMGEFDIQRAVVPRGRILVVDDNEDAADSLGMVLESLGADVTVVHDGASAMDAIERFHPAVVLLDLGMPGIDGYEVARWVRQRASLADVKLIALTGWGYEEQRRLSREAGFDHHLVKPVSQRPRGSPPRGGGRQGSNGTTVSLGTAESWDSRHARRRRYSRMRSWRSSVKKGASRAIGTGRPPSPQAPSGTSTIVIQKSAPVPCFGIAATSRTTASSRSNKLDFIASFRGPP